MINVALKLRKISLFLYFCAFILSLAGLIFAGEISVNISGIDFYYDKINASVLFAGNFMLLLFNLNSKISLKSIRRFYYPFSVVLLFLFNLTVLSNNLIYTLGFLFFVFLIHYFLEKSKPHLILDSSVLFVAFVLFSYGLIRYFVLNDISITFANIEKYLDILDEMNPKLIFCGFLILIFRLFGFIPFNIGYKNSIVTSLYNIIYTIVGSVLTIKIYPIFSEYFYNYQNILMAYLLLNALYFSLIQFKSKTIIDFLRLSSGANIAVCFFGLFLFSEYGFASFIYFMLGILLTHCAGFLIADILKNKTGAYDFCAFKKISHKDKILKAFIFIVFLALAKTPPFISFFSGVYSMLNIFMIDFSSLWFIPYILFGCIFLLSLNSISVISKILAEPTRELKSSVLKYSQYTTMYLICAFLVFFGIGAKYVIEYLIKIIDAGIF